MKVITPITLGAVIFGAASAALAKPAPQTDSPSTKDYGDSPEDLNEVNIIGDRANNRRNAWWNRGDVALFEEYLATGERRIDGLTEQEIVRTAVELAEQAQRDTNGTARRRSFHAKGQACLKGTLQVEDLSGSDKAELRFGVFSTMRSYDVWGRFSSGSGQIQSDAVNDPRGFAVKVMNVQGSPVDPDFVDPLPTDGEGFMHQDFLGTNSPVFPTRNAKTFIDFHAATLEGGLTMVKFLANVKKDGPRTADILRKWIDPNVGSLADLTYGSGGAFQMGERAGKYWLKACDGNRKAVKPDNPGEDYLTEELSTRLNSGSREVCMQLEVQIQRHPKLHPIEDASVLWKDIPANVEVDRFYRNPELRPAESKKRSGAFVKVATIRFPLEGNQDFRSDARRAQCEGMFFNTWHSTAAHRPLGNINRVRRDVYKASFLYRDKP